LRIVSDERVNRRLGNPGVFALATFGFALTALSFQLLVNPDTAGVTLYAVLVAAIGETIGGMWSIARGDTYIAGILTTFGIWLFGFYMLLTQGAANGLVNPQTEGAYVLLLIIPIAYMAIPAFVGRLPVFSLIFVALLAMFFFLGFGFYFEVRTLETIAGVLALVAALPLYYVSYQEAAAEGPGASAAEDAVEEQEEAPVRK
jgi:succinate-acetate transporter protein